MGNLASKKKKHHQSNITATRASASIDNKLLFNSDEEIDRVQVEHHMYRTIWGGNFIAPVREILMEGGAWVLDFGCGPGTWACDMSSDFQKSTFVGVELISLFPTIHPSNVQFIKCDLDSGLPFSDNQFDFVHIRLKYLNYTKDQWRNMVVQELVRVLKPGGWIEIFELECDGVNIGPISSEYVRVFREATVKKNLDPDLVFHLPEILASIRDIDPKTIQHVTKTVPLGSWGGTIGTMVENNSMELMRKIHIMLKVEEGEAEELRVKLQHELSAYKSSVRLHRFYAMKSLGPKEAASNKKRID